MKTTPKLPDKLMLRAKNRAKLSNIKLWEDVENVIRSGSQAVEFGEDSRVALKSRVHPNADGYVTNPGGTDCLGFFDALEEIRELSRRETPRDPFR